VEWLRRQLSRSGANGFVVGLSGGIDSAVVARLCQAAAPANILAAIMPCHSDPQDEVYARLLADHFGIPTVRVDLSPVHDVLVEDLRYLAEHLPEAQRAAAHPPDDLRARAPMANVKPRLRMTTLYFLANTLNYLVAGTGNRSELAIGYFTKHGDGGVDLLPIGHLLKGDVREAARELGVPEDILVRPPTAGLWAGQTDEEEMGFTYAELDACLAKGPDSVSPALAKRIERLVRQTEHKRAVPPTPDSST
jgi:NAD+ synthase